MWTAYAAIYSNLPNNSDLVELTGIRVAKNNLLDKN